MKWEDQRESDNIDDLRNDSGGGFPIGLPHVGVGGVLLALLASWLFGINPLTVLGLMGRDGGAGNAPLHQQLPQTTPEARSGKPTDPAARFASVVLADTEDVWGAYFSQRGQHYQAPRLELYRGQTRTGCGTGQAAMGPFYCPADRKIWLDLSFNDVLSQRLGAPGQFAQAYVIAHEVGHHIQNLQGISDKMEAARQRLSTRDYNALSVRLELQADCYAGVWANLTQKGKDWIEPGEVEQALNAASQIGDDTLQRRAQGTVVPETFTHGTSAQRVRWFKRGLDAGDLKACDTFGAATSQL